MNRFGQRAYQYKVSGYSNAIPLCFFDQACIKRREEDEARAAAAIQQQQAMLMQLANTPTGRLSGGNLALIFLGVIAAGGFVFYLIKTNKL